MWEYPGKVPGAAMGYCDSGVTVKKHFGHRKADDIASSYDDSTFAFDLHPRFLKHTDHSLGRTRIHTLAFLPERGHIRRMETVDIFLMGDSLDDTILIYMGRHGKLHKHPVYSIVPIKIADYSEKFFFRSIFRKADRGALISYLLGIFSF